MRFSKALGFSALFACLITIAQFVSVAAAEETSTREPREYPSRGLYLPAMSAERGKQLFVKKGCVVCHSVNGVGGQHASRLDAAITQGFVNPFDFVGRMWRGAKLMIGLQNEMLGEQLGFTGQELADLIAFAHDEEEQRKLSESDLPPKIRELVETWSP